MIGFEWGTCMSQRRRAVELGTNLPTLLTGAAAISLLTLKIAIVGLWDAFTITISLTSRTCTTTCYQSTNIYTLLWLTSCWSVDKNNIHTQTNVNSTMLAKLIWKPCKYYISAHWWLSNFPKISGMWRVLKRQCFNNSNAVSLPTNTQGALYAFCIRNKFDSFYEGQDRPTKQLQKWYEI